MPLSSHGSCHETTTVKTEIWIAIRKLTAVLMKTIIIIIIIIIIFTIIIIIIIIIFKPELT